MSGSVRVKQINWIGVDEADMLLTDGTHECWAFCHPCHYSEADEGLGGLQASNTREARISLETESKFELRRGTSGHPYRVVGRVSDTGAMTVAKEGSITIGSFEIEFVRLPGDVEVGDYVELEIGRLVYI